MSWVLINYEYIVFNNFVFIQKYLKLSVNEVFQVTSAFELAIRETQIVNEKLAFTNPFPKTFYFRKSNINP